MPRVRAVLILTLIFAGCDDEGPVPEPGGTERASPPATLNTAASECPAAFGNPVADQAEFEYVVVGSGAGGGPLAARLAEAGHSVLLLEAGGCVANKNYLIPALHGLATEDPALAGAYFVKHYEDAKRSDTNNRNAGKNPQEILYPRGLGVGGSTGVNAMITVLPHEDDWSDTFGLSPAGARSFQEKYYARVMTWLGVQLPDTGALLGAGGNRFAEADEKLLAAVLAAVKTFGDMDNLFPVDKLFDLIAQFDNTFNVLLSKNLNDARLADPELEGVFSFPLATRNRARNGTRERIVAAFKKTGKLTVKTNALVTRVVFEEGTTRAIGVEYLDGGRIYEAHIGKKADASTAQTRQVRAKNDVILSAGAYNTPQILMLSGIGPSADLQALGIAPLSPDNDAHQLVGTNLQDRYEVGVVHELKKQTTFGLPNNPFAHLHFRALRNCAFTGAPDDECTQRWINGGLGVYGTNGSVVSILKRSPGALRPDLHLFGVPGVFRGYHVNYSKEATADKKHFTWLVLKGYNQNRAGTVKLAGVEPWRMPKINFHNFYEGDAAAEKPDMDPMVHAIHFVREIVDEHNDFLEDIGFELVESWPGRDRKTDKALAEWVDQEAWGHHACCTTAIGRVLDDKFAVKGTEHLRVVDASAFPRIPGTFIVLPTYMLSERAADVILGQ